MTWKERKLLEHFRRIPLKDPSVVVGPGDDCAVVRYGGAIHVVTTDLIACGTDFLESADMYDVGWKCIMVSASDIAAMGCRPLHYVVASDIPKGYSEEQLARLWQGLYEAAAKTDALIIGGDLSAGDRLLLVSTAVGIPFSGSPLLRNGASRDDIVFVTGRLGGSILGKHLKFMPRLDAAEILAGSGLVTAMMDLSDGLSGDLTALADASHCDFCIDADSIPISDAAYEMAKSDGRTALRHALDDGEDFELLFTTASDSANDISALLGSAGIEHFRIGRMTDPGTGRFLVNGNSRTPWEIRSYEHGA